MSNNEVCLADAFLGCSDSVNWHYIELRRQLLTQMGTLSLTSSTNFRHSSFIPQWLYNPLLGPGLFFTFVILITKTVGLLGRGISPPQGRYLHTGQHKQNKRPHRCPWLWVWFEPTIPTFEWGKTVHALHSAATVISGILTGGEFRYTLTRDFRSVKLPTRGMTRPG
jgi:hypothetical protein